jgi:hypothetical protein
LAIFARTVVTINAEDAFGLDPDTPLLIVVSKKKPPGHGKKRSSGEPRDTNHGDTTRKQENNSGRKPFIHGQGYQLS